MKNLVSARAYVVTWNGLLDNPDFVLFSYNHGDVEDEIISDKEGMLLACSRVELFRELKKVCPIKFKAFPDPVALGEEVVQVNVREAMEILVSENQDSDGILYDFFAMLDNILKNLARESCSNEFQPASIVKSMRELRDYLWDHGDVRGFFMGGKGKVCFMKELEVTLRYIISKVRIIGGGGA